MAVYIRHSMDLSRKVTCSNVFNSSTARRRNSNVSSPDLAGNYRNDPAASIARTSSLMARPSQSIDERLDKRWWDPLVKEFGKTPRETSGVYADQAESLVQYFG